MYGNMRNDGEESGEERIVEEREMEAKTDAKEFFCSDEVEEEIVFVITNEPWLTGRKQEKRGGRETEEVTEMGLQWRVELRRSMDLTDS